MVRGAGMIDVLSRACQLHPDVIAITRPARDRATRAAAFRTAGARSDSSFRAAEDGRVRVDPKFRAAVIVRLSRLQRATRIDGRIRYRDGACPIDSRDVTHPSLDQFVRARPSPRLRRRAADWFRRAPPRRAQSDDRLSRHARAPPAPDRARRRIRSTTRGTRPAFADGVLLADPCRRAPSARRRAHRQQTAAAAQRRQQIAQRIGDQDQIAVRRRLFQGFQQRIGRMADSSHRHW